VRGWPILVVACFALAMIAAVADERIKDGCVIGESAMAHGRSEPQAIADIQRYGQLYVSNFQRYRKTERSVRAQINALLELEQWTQADIVMFTKQQRELLYLSIGMQLANGRITADELPEYARSVRQRVADIEIELGCDLMLGS